jgi:RsiW-degrading membrane proteinase PrsW (M82 family)
MTTKYYLRNIFWGLIPVAIMIYDWMTKQHTDKQLFMLVFSLISGPLFPLSKLTIETIALKFTKKEFWHKGFFKEDIGKNGLRAIFWLFCFVFAIPISIISLFISKKRPDENLAD